MKELKRLEAIDLRKTGKSMKDIAKQLCVSKGSVSRWVKDVELNEGQKRALKDKMVENGRSVMSYLQGSGKSNKQKADIRKKEFRRLGFDMAEKDSEFRVICALYWGEGTKNSGIASIGNSDANLLKVWGKWLIKNGYGNIIFFSVQHYEENKISEVEIRKWWMGKLPFLSNDNFKKIYRCKISRASQRKRVGMLPYGTAILKVCRVELLYKILGGIDYLSGN